MNDATEAPRLLKPPQAAERLGLSVATLAKHRCQATGPVFVRIGAAIRYPSDELDAYIAKQPRRTSTADNSNAA